MIIYNSARNGFKVQRERIYDLGMDDIGTDTKSLTFSDSQDLNLMKDTILFAFSKTKKLDKLKVFLSKFTCQAIRTVDIDFSSTIHWCLMYSSTANPFDSISFFPFSILDIRRRERSYRWIMTAHRHLTLPRRMWTRWRSPWARWTFHLPVDHVEDMTLTPIIHLLHTLDQLEQRPLPILFHHLLQQGKTQKKI